MTGNGYFQLALYLITLIGLAWPLGLYMARVYKDEIPGFMRWLKPVENLVYRLTGVKPGDDMPWTRYAFAMLAFNLIGFLAVYLLQRFQVWLPLNPEGLGAVTPDSAFNTAVSFATNTNWQGYGGETTMAYLTQMLGLNVQNFVSAATGMAVLVALMRAFTRREAGGVGNFWVDMVRSTLYILLPLSLILSLALVSQGVVQSFSAYEKAALVQPYAQAETTVTEQVIAVGPAASQIAIKQLGTNGGGFFNVNSAHPLENPTPLSNFLELLAILLIPAALCFTFGRFVGDMRQGGAILAAMTVVFTALLAVCVWAEQSGNPLFDRLGLATGASEMQAGGNMEGKETRFGVVNSALWATATTAASNGSVNSMHDSFTPIGGMVPMWLIQLGEVIYGGVGSGLYGMIVFALIGVFIAGLMIGRTPEYLGKKIEAFEVKMAAVAILIPPLVVLVGTALAVGLDVGRAGIFNPGAHGFSEVLYALSSAGNNNGSAFGGLSANTPFYNTLLGMAMLLSRYWLMIPVLGIAGSLAAKKIVPAGSGTLPTHTPLFVLLLVVTVLLVGALTFVPALALGPVVEQLQMLGVK
ncbi:MAG: potassium-transporting ATPase subunit KdpA [Hydrogenophilales bacterium]|nr:potassium-transporting ATPase subunit KdpA [Hydrogenophilales bacterium]